MRCLVFKFLFTSYEFLITQSHCNYKMYIMANGVKPAIIFRILLKIFVSLSHQVKLLLRRFTEKSQKKNNPKTIISKLLTDNSAVVRKDHIQHKRGHFYRYLTFFKLLFYFFLNNLLFNNNCKCSVGTQTGSVLT